VASVGNYSGKRNKKPYEFLLHLEVSEATDGASLRSSTITFKTITLAEASHIHAPSDFLTDVGAARKNAKASDVKLTGVIDVVARDFNTSQVSLKVSMEVENKGGSTTENHGPVLSSSLRERIGGLSIGQSVGPPSALQGRLPSDELAAAVSEHLISAVPNLFARFARCDAVDAATLERFEINLTGSAPPTNAHETWLTTKSLGFDNVDPNAGSEGWKRIPGTAAHSVAYFQQKIPGATRGKAIAQVDAPAKRVCSWLWNINTYERINHVIASGQIGLLRRVEYIPDSCSMFYSNVVPLPMPLGDRVFSTWFALCRENDGSLILSYAPIEDYPEKAKVEQHLSVVGRDARGAAATRGFIWGFYRITPITENTCEVTYVAQANLGGSLPIKLLRMLVKETLNTVDVIQSR
jgi:hypothetical protein